MLTATQRTEMSHCIVSTLIESGRGFRAAALAERLQLPHRHVVARLQALKRRGIVTYEHGDGSPSTPGIWAISEQGRQIVSQTGTLTAERYTTGTERGESHSLHASLL
jgi:predicted ArsR family transcriptional regulator